MFFQRCFARTRQAAEQLSLPEWDEDTIPAAAAPAPAAVPAAAATSSTDTATHALLGTATETATVLQRSIDRKRYQLQYDHLHQKVRTSPVYYYRTDNCYLQMAYLRFA